MCRMCYQNVTSCGENRKVRLQKMRGLRSPKTWRGVDSRKPKMGWITGGICERCLILSQTSATQQEKRFELVRHLSGKLPFHFRFPPGILLVRKTSHVCNLLVVQLFHSLRIIPL